MASLIGDNQADLFNRAGSVHSPEFQINPLAADLDHILRNTIGLWEGLRNQRIFITGGTGFFGRWLLESFAWANQMLGLNARAVVLTRNFQAFAKKAPALARNVSIRFHEGDIRDFDFPEGEFSHIVHAAADSGKGLNDVSPGVMFNTIVDGARRALDFAAGCGAAKFLFVSSGAAYGKQPPQLTHIPEEYDGAPDTMEPFSAYGEGKRGGELLCRLYAADGRLEIKIARCFAFGGPFLPLESHFAFGNFIRDAMNGGPIGVKGDGAPYRSYLYAADLAIWLWTILFKGESCRIYNVGSEEAVSIAELADAVAHALPAPVEVKIGAPRRSGPAERYVPSTKRARSELGVRQMVDLRTAISRTLAYCSSTAL